MHYLEDYLEIIEYLPAELKARFHQIRALDDHVQVQLESLNDRTKTFFSLCRKNNKPELREQQYQNLCQEYETVMKDSEEKIKLGSQIHDLLDRHLRRVDQDLSRFTIELEADTAGITEILEQKSYLLDRPPTPEKPVTGQKRNRHAAILHDDFMNGDIDDYSPSPSTRASPAPLSRMKYSRRDKEKLSLLHLPTSDIDSDILDFDDQFTPSSLYAGTGGKPPLTFAMSDPKPMRKQRSGLMNQPSPIMAESVLTEPSEWMVDPNEPRYCLCNQVSYGEMVGCDNPECTIEWFHYGCVSIKEPPKGKWYCPQCMVSTKKKGSRKNIG